MFNAVTDTMQSAAPRLPLQSVVPVLCGWFDGVPRAARCTDLSYLVHCNTAVALSCPILFFC